MASRGFRSVFAVIAVALLLAACGDEEASLDPPEIVYGEDISEMGMFVVDPRYTVATLPDDEEEWLLFDDIGELLKYRDSNPDASFQVIWVNDYHDEDWLTAEDAWYVESTEINTPMGWGVAAFRDEADARALSDEMGGDVMTWDDVEDREWTAPPAPIDHAAHEASPGATPARDAGATPAGTPAGELDATPQATLDHSGH